MDGTGRSSAAKIFGRTCLHDVRQHHQVQILEASLVSTLETKAMMIKLGAVGAGTRARAPGQPDAWYYDESCGPGKMERSPIRAKVERRSERSASCSATNVQDCEKERSVSRNCGWCWCVPHMRAEDENSWPFSHHATVCVSS